METSSSPFLSILHLGDVHKGTGEFMFFLRCLIMKTINILPTFEICCYFFSASVYTGVDFCKKLCGVSIVRRWVFYQVLIWSVFVILQWTLFSQNGGIDLSLVTYDKVMMNLSSGFSPIFFFWMFDTCLHWCGNFCFNYVGCNFLCFSFVFTIKSFSYLLIIVVKAWKMHYVHVAKE